MGNITHVSASIVGGIGDIIFGLEGFKEICNFASSNNNRSTIDTTCYLCSHCPDADKLVKANPYVDHISNIGFNFDMSHHDILHNRTKNDPTFLGEAYSFCYTINPEIFVPEQIQKSVFRSFIKSKTERKIVVIHPIGSSFSRHFLGNVAKKSTKEMPSSVWERLTTEILSTINDCCIYVVGSQEDNKIMQNWKLSANNLSGELSILESVELIKKSSLVIGVDSFAKSISLACNVPTVVLVNDSEDKFRDDVFINPYIKQETAKFIIGANKMSSDKLVKQIVEEACNHLL